MSDGRKTRGKIGQKNEKAKLDKEWSQVQGISEKSTGAFKFGCRVMFWSQVFIYPKFASKAVSSVYLSNSIEFTKKNIHFILNVNIEACFENKSSSLTLKYRPVHFSE